MRFHTLKVILVTVIYEIAKKRKKLPYVIFAFKLLSRFVVGSAARRERLRRFGDERKLIEKCRVVAVNFIAERFAVVDNREGCVHHVVSQTPPAKKRHSLASSETVCARRKSVSGIESQKRQTAVAFDSE